MKNWNRWILGGSIMILALSFCVGTSYAAQKKKKKAVEEETTTTIERTIQPSKHYLTGANLDGRSGLFYGDTSEVAREGAWEGSAHLTYQSIGYYNSSESLIGIPVGAHFGIAKDFELSAGAQLDIDSFPSYTYRSPYYPFTEVTVAGGSSTYFTVMGGAKYRFAGDRDMPDFSFGGNIRIPTYTGGQVVVMPEGTVTYTLTNGLLLNGDMGVGISNTTYIKADIGAGYPISEQVTGIAEIGANQAGYTGSVFAFGVRAAISDIKFQGLVGVPLNGGSVLVGGGIILASK